MSMNNGYVDVLIGGQYGSEGKGQIAAYIAPEYDILVRVGGPNAGHTVYAEPTPHKFHHLPSGTSSSSATLVLGPGAVLWPSRLFEEISEFGVSPDRLYIDPQAMVIDAKDRHGEDKLRETIGSTGQGVGCATARKVLRTAADPAVQLAIDIEELKPFVRPTVPMMREAFMAGGRVLLEGTQGTGLSLHHGPYPHVTSRDTTASGCLSEAGISPRRVRRIIMVCRTYPIRVESPSGGTSGRLENEITLQDISDRSGIPLDELEATEKTTTTGRRRRIGEFDWDLLKRSTALNEPTDIALTFADYLARSNREADSLSDCTEHTRSFIDNVESTTGIPVSLISVRFHRQGILDRRDWR